MSKILRVVVLEPPLFLLNKGSCSCAHWSALVDPNFRAICYTEAELQLAFSDLRFGNVIRIEGPFYWAIWLFLPTRSSGVFLVARHVINMHRSDGHVMARSKKSTTGYCRHWVRCCKL